MRARGSQHSTRSFFLQVRERGRVFSLLILRTHHQKKEKKNFRSPSSFACSSWSVSLSFFPTGHDRRRSLPVCVPLLKSSLSCSKALKEKERGKGISFSPLVVVGPSNQSSLFFFHSSLCRYVFAFSSAYQGAAAALGMSVL